MKNSIIIIFIAVVLLALLAGLVLYKHTSTVTESKSEISLELFDEPDEYFDEIMRYPVSRVQPDVKYLDIILNLPQGQKLNDQAPFLLAAKSENDEAVSVGTNEITQASKRLRIPLDIYEGSTTLIAIADFSYCGTIDSSLCFFRKAKLEIPVTVDSAGSSVWELKYSVGK